LKETDRKFDVKVVGEPGSPLKPGTEKGLTRPRTPQRMEPPPPSHSKVLPRLGVRKRKIRPVGLGGPKNQVFPPKPPPLGPPLFGCRGTLNFVFFVKKKPHQAKEKPSYKKRSKKKCPMSATPTPPPQMKKQNKFPKALKRGETKKPPPLVKFLPPRQFYLRENVFLTLKGTEEIPPQNFCQNSQNHKKNPFP